MSRVLLAFYTNRSGVLTPLLHLLGGPTTAVSLCLRFSERYSLVSTKLVKKKTLYIEWWCYNHSHTAKKWHTRSRQWVLIKTFTSTSWYFFHISWHKWWWGRFPSSEDLWRSLVPPPEGSICPEHGTKTYVYSLNQCIWVTNPEVLAF